MPPVRKSSRATIIQVAKRAGVSTKTVSRVTNGEPSVRPDLRARVEEAVRHLDYHPSLAARSLAGRRSFLLAMAYDNPSPSYLLNLQAGARAESHFRGYRLLFHPCKTDVPNLAEELIGLADDPGIEGLVLSPPLSTRRALIERLRAAQLPLALIAPPFEGGDAVTIDDEAAGFAATVHLLELGHRRIGFICGHPDHAASPQRRRGYERALGDAGLAPDPRLIEPGEFSFESGRSAARTLLARGRERPTAILASNDDMAAGVIAEAHELGLTLPQELSVMGFDDAPLAQMLWPPLTTMSQPIAELARLAVRRLLDRLQGAQSSEAATPLAFHLVRRSSTCPPG
jgi:LacI family transcriptional regulator, galactose operon repressor